MARNVLTVKVLEVRELDTLAHAQDVRSAAQAIDQHPDVSGVEGREGNGGLGGAMTVRVERSADIGPSSNDGREDHETEREQGHAGDGTSEPENFSIGNQDDCKILEDGVDGN